MGEPVPGERMGLSDLRLCARTGAALPGRPLRRLPQDCPERIAPAPTPGSRVVGYFELMAGLDRVLYFLLAAKLYFRRKVFSFVLGQASWIIQNPRGKERAAAQ